ncbi:MAG: SLBB domain-containing protein [bacterium]
MKISGLWRHALSVACIGIVGLTPSARAQSSIDPDPNSALETRSLLETEALKAEAQHRTAEAFLLRSRLKRGDFQDGDRVVVKILGSASVLPGVMPANDTLILRAGKVLLLGEKGQMGELSLDGVLRSELNAKVSHHLAKYLTDSSVQTTPLIRLAVLGQVRSPNYYYTTVDVLLSDIIMKAGGPTSTADWLGNMWIRRGSETIWNQQDTRTAMADGISLERLHLRAGDELYVDDVKSGFSWTTVAQFLGPALGILYAFRRVF